MSTPPDGKRKRPKAEYSNEDIKNAIVCIISKKWSLAKAADKHNIPRSTLDYHMRRLKEVCTDKHRKMLETGKYESGEGSTTGSEKQEISDDNISLKSDAEEEPSSSSKNADDIVVLNVKEKDKKSPLKHLPSTSTSFDGEKKKISPKGKMITSPKTDVVVKEISKKEENTMGDQDAHPNVQQQGGLASNFTQARIRTIMKSSSEVTLIAQDALVVMTKACEYFVAYLAHRAFDKRVHQKTTDYDDLATYVQNDEELQFLHDILPKKVLVKDLPMFKNKQQQQSPKKKARTSS